VSTRPVEVNLEAIIAAVLAVEPGLDRQLVAEAVAATAPSRRQQHWLQQALTQDPSCLVSGASSVPLGVAQLIRRLRAAGAARLVVPCCARCGQPRLLRHKHGDQRVCDWCRRVLHAELCIRCGERRPTMVRTDHGPVCFRCRRQDRGTWKPCSQCGRPCTVQARSDDGQPLCWRCAPRRLRPCAVCGQQRVIHAHLLDGPTCGACYNRIRSSPQPCPGCGQPRVLQHLDEAGRRVCGPCAGVASRYACARCGTDCMRYRDGLCPRCLLDQQVTALLTGPDGTISPALRPLHRALVEVTEPRSTLNWLRTSAGPKILAAMAAGELAVSHDALDRLPQTKPLDFLRDLLVAAGVLAPRQTDFARLEPWLDGLLATAPHEHARLVRVFATWDAFRRLRPKATAGRLTENASRRARSQVRQALALLAWLDEQGVPLAELRQDDLDRWLAAGPTTRLAVRAFLQWAKARRLAGDLHVPFATTRSPAAPVADDERWALIERLLHDQAVAIDLRVAGLFALLYGQPLTRIVRLTTGHVTHANDRVAVRFGNDDLVLPEPLGQLTLALRDRRGHAALGNQTRQWLFPGGAPGRHVTANSLRVRLNGVGVVLRAARHAAMLQLAAEIPAPILADLLNLHPIIAVRWVKAARGDWASYVSERSSTLSADPRKSSPSPAEGG
jgi:hypothetical protein